MRFFGLSFFFFVAAACLSGCGRTPATGPVAPHGGRYFGIGVYQAGQLWSRMAAARPANGPAATIADDDEIIVVVDSNTGEIRQCGNLSGHCIGMNPWTGALARGQAAPVELNAHAAELDRATAFNAATDAEMDEAASRAAPARRR